MKEEEYKHILGELQKLPKEINYQINLIPHMRDKINHITIQPSNHKTITLISSINGEPSLWDKKAQNMPHTKYTFVFNRNTITFAIYMKTIADGK